MMTFYFRKWQTSALFLVVLFLISCSKEENVTINLSAQTNSTVTSAAASQFLNIQTNGDWKIDLTYISGGIGWISINSASGKGDADAILQFTQNTSPEARVAEFSVKSGDKEVNLFLTQQAIPSVPTVGGRNPNPIWLEIPSGGTNSDCITLTHDIIINTKTVRNYSFLYDKKEKIAYWVAYPHHPSYIGNTGRTDNWQLDPSVSSMFQVDYFSTIAGYDRGHQIPSADRTVSTLANNQTFYFTNMTPQLGVLNQQLWANLETQVRGWMNASDTLYVVTGAILKTVGGSETVKYATDSKGGKVAVPNYYYKVLLRLKNGKYDSIGFWVEHKGYGSVQATASIAKTVDQIEQLTGFNFFSSLPKTIQDEAEATISPSNWGLQ
jgi:DNA/RNA endonuclease G (NUC1)